MCGTRSPKISLGSPTPRSLNCPRDARRPSQRPAASANREEKRRWRSSLSQSFSIRTTSLTAGPMTVKSSRSAAPTLPYSTSPTWSAMSTSVKGSPSAWRRRFRDSTFSKLSTAASRPRLQATLSSTSSNDIVASIASPMNLRTWPPRGRQHLKGLVQHLDDLRARGHVADPREASQIRVPQHRVETVDSSALDRAGVNARARVVPKIGPQKSGGDVMAGVSLHRERQFRQGRVQEFDFRIMEAAGTIGREGIENTSPVRGVGVLAEPEAEAEI